MAAIDLPQYRRFQGCSRATEMAVRRTYVELTTGLDRAPGPLALHRLRSLAVE